MAVNDELSEEFPFEEEYGPFCGIFGNNKNVELLQLLLSIPDLSLNKSQLARVLETSFHTVSKVLIQLEKFDVVILNENTRGREKVYSLNLNSPVVKLIDRINLMLYAENEPSFNELLLPNREYFGNAIELRSSPTIRINIDPTFLVNYLQNISSSSSEESGINSFNRDEYGSSSQHYYPMEAV